jgi:hypothetical protein
MALVLLYGAGALAGPDLLTCYGGVVLLLLGCSC